MIAHAHYGIKTFPPHPLRYKGSHSLMICLPPQGPPPNTAADTAHSAHSTQPALRPHRATPRVEDKSSPPGTRGLTHSPLRYEIDLYTILLLPTLYGVWHTQRRSRGGLILPTSRAVVLQQCGQCRWAGGRKGPLIRAQTTLSRKVHVPLRRTWVWALRKG